MPNQSDSSALRDAIAALPRVRLTSLPTPLQKMARLREALGGPRLFIKRDDLTGLALGGNKSRMFEFVLAKALADGATAVVGGAAAQSNYARLLAAGCALVGLECHLVLRRIAGQLEQTADGNLLLDNLLGARVTVIDDDREEQVRRQQELAQRLEVAGHRVFLVPRASNEHNALHSVAYVLAAIELQEQLDVQGIAPTHIYVASLDMTYAGLLVGMNALGSRATLVAVSPFESSTWPAERIRRKVVALTGDIAAILGIEPAVSADDVKPRVGHADGGYGMPTRDDIEAIRLFATSEAILLDPVYTSKAAAALVADIAARRLKRSDTVVFWHTGGSPALFPYREHLLSRVDGIGGG